MVKKVLLSLSAALSLAVTAGAQHATCATDEANLRAKKFNPQIVAFEAQLEAEIERNMRKMDISRFAKTNGLLDTVYHIPLVFHIIHNYGSSYITDNEVYTAVREINELYDKRNADTAVVITPFRGKIRGTNNYYIAKSGIQFHLATKDPMGNPTHGITRRQSLLTNVAGDQAKFDQWAPDAYINIWIIQTFNSNHTEAAAYAYKPGSAAGLPFYDGIIGIQQGGNINLDNTLGHELGHVLNLDHTWGGTNQPDVACGDDAVDDTPPTKGHNNFGGVCGPTAPASAKLWDTTCTHTTLMMQKDAIDSPITVNSLADNSTTNSINFTVRTEITLRSVVVYPSVTPGTSYTIELVDSATNNLLQTYAGTTGISDTPNLASLNFRIFPGKYKLRFGNNPGMRRGNLGGGYTKTIPGAITVTSDSAGGRYNYFYKWQVQHGFFKLYDASQMASLYDTTLTPYVYVKEGNKFLVDYPDTTNGQNVMDYSYCSRMFTNGQALRMRASLRSNIAGRNKLWSPSNLINTGALDPRPDLPVIIDFSSSRPFTCASSGLSSNVVLTNRSWNDTVSGLSWTLPGGSPATSTANSVTVAFNDTGWQAITLKATSSVNGTPTEVSATRNNVVYVASNTPTDINYVQEFNTDLKGWPIMNYSDNFTKWELADVGYYDNKSIRFKNFDNRAAPAVYTNSPDGQYADFYTPAYDLSGFPSNAPCNINFMSAGATRAGLVDDMRDTLEISYSTNCGSNWAALPGGRISKVNLANNGTVAAEFTPAWMGAWRGQAINIPAVARQAKTYFRFRYIPHADLDYFFSNSFGNNVYVDRIHITDNTLGVDEGLLTDRGFLLSPNPTSGSASIVVKGGRGNVNVVVTDMAGRVVYLSETAVRQATTSIEIPSSNIAAKGVYMVRVTVEGKSNTEKLVVY